MLFPLTLIRAAGLPFEHLLTLGKDIQGEITSYESLKNAEKETHQMLLNQLSISLQKLPLGEIRTLVYKFRQQIFKGKNLSYLQKNTISQINTPEIVTLLAEIDRWEHTQIMAENAFNLIKSNWENLLLDNYRSIQKTVLDEKFQRGLLLTSHDLWLQIPLFCQTAPLDFKKNEHKTALSLFQYLARATAKTSPFSHFTSVSIQEISQLGEPKDDIFLTEKSIVTPNVALLEALYELLLQYPVFYQNIPLKLNPCIVKVSTVYEFIYFDGEHESFQTLQSDATVDLIVAHLLAPRTIGFKELQAFLGEEIEAESADLEAFILDLTSIGLLEWDFPEKGLSPSWCGTLMNFLGFLPSEPIIVETAALLQWWRTTARTLPWQSVTEVHKIQLETKAKTAAFFLDFGGKLPELKAEQYFYEDVLSDFTVDFSADELKENLSAVSRFITNKKNTQQTVFEKSKEQKLISRFLEEKGGEVLDFLGFARDFLVWKKAGEDTINEQISPNSESASLVGKQIAISQNPPNQAQFGLLLQPFRDDNGQLCSVVNALYGNPGRMFARWMPYHEKMQNSVQNWLSKPHYEDNSTISWVSNSNLGATNANFHPLPATDFHLDAPMSKHRSGAKGRILLGDLRISNSGVTQSGSETIIFLQLLDWGLEAIDTKTPIAQLLQRCMSQNVSLSALLGDMRSDWQTLETGVKYRSRIFTENVVLSRATWQIESDVWNKVGRKVGRVKNPSDLHPSDLTSAPFNFFWQINIWRKTLNMPRFVFFQVDKNKPQYLDFYSPIGVLLFQKTIKNGTGNLYITEMLPTPFEQTEANKMHFVYELVCELDVATQNT
jgi:hypothetical protein